MNRWLSFNDEELLQIIEAFNALDRVTDEQEILWKEILNELEERPDRPIEIEDIDKVYAYDE